MIKVLHIISSIGAPGGVQSMLWSYYKYIDEKNVRFDFVSFDTELSGYEKRFVDKDSRLYFVTPKKKGLFKHIREMNRIFKQKEHDIVHIHQDFLGVIDLILAWLNGFKVRIVHTHKANLKESRTKRIQHKLLSYITLLFATHICGCSNEALEWTFGKTKSQSNRMVITNAIETANYVFDKDTRNRVRAELGIDDDCVLLGNVARFTNQKNHKFLIDVVSKLASEKFNFKLVLVGSGELFEQVSDYIKQKKLTDFVIMLGNRNDVNDLMQAMDIFVLPSVWEGLGIVLVEAQVSGLKCISSTAVPKEVDLTNTVDFLSINDIEPWCTAIKKISYEERKDCSSVIGSKGYDIKLEAVKLKKKICLQIFQ